ncbi:IS66 family insertion sequence element accessory protein TnpB, partial [Massilia eurypsychrophila]
ADQDHIDRKAHPFEVEHVESSWVRAPQLTRLPRRCSLMRQNLWICLRRLHRGQFVWPQAHETSWQLTDEQWQWLIAGVDWQRLVAPAPAQWQL